jgi:hypothetical protein
MIRRRTTAYAVALFAASLTEAVAGDQAAPWDFAPTATACSECAAPCRKAPPMFGDQFQFGFNFNGGFNFGGGFQGGFQGGGGGGFQLGGGFQGGGGGFQVGGGFQGGFGAPVAVARGAFKIAENGVARPEDRVFGTYNYYDNVLKTLNVHRQMVGFEKTFFDGAASLEMRLPFIQNDVQNSSDREDDIADLSFILKYAIVDQPDRVLSVGVATTAPTGPVPTVLIVRPEGFDRVHPWQIQPFIGYYRSFGNWYVQGFTSAMIPTDSRDAPWLFNDVGVGYFLYEGSGMLRSIVPTVEAHVNTPLDNRGDVGFADSIDLTAGSYFQFGERMTLGLAAGTPVTGPKLFSFEAIASLNWRF